MRYFVTIADRTLEVELTPEGARIDGRPVQAELVSIPGTPVRHLLLDGHSWPLVANAGEAKGAWQLQLDGQRFEIDVVDERTRAIRAMTARSAEGTGPRPVCAPMPGLVSRVQVSPGDAVAPGQGVVIIEAMKMENELKAEAAGVVARILVAAGEAVEKGTVLVEFRTEG